MKIINDDRYRIFSIYIYIYIYIQFSPEIILNDCSIFPDKYNNKENLIAANRFANIHKIVFLSYSIENLEWHFEISAVHYLLRSLEESLLLQVHQMSSCGNHSEFRPSLECSLCFT